MNIMMDTLKTKLTRCTVLFACFALVQSVNAQHESTDTEVIVSPESFLGLEDIPKTFNPTRTSNSRIKSGYDDSLDFGLYKTYNFRSQTAIENPDFHELLGMTFSAATEQQMLSRGYVRSDNPDILINISMDMIDKQRAPNQKGNCPSYADYYSQKPSGYYKYSGRKQARLAESRSTFCAYTEGSISVDMVDVKLRRTIWQGISTVRVDEKEREFLLNGHLLNGEVGSVINDVKRRSTFKYDSSRLTDDEIDRGYLVMGYILDDVAIMFEDSPFREPNQAQAD